MITLRDSKKKNDYVLTHNGVNFEYKIIKIFLKPLKKLFSPFPNDYECSFAFIRERLRMIMNGYKRWKS
jgi:hypothetical protein